MTIEAQELELKVNAMLELGEVSEPVAQYIELLQDTISNYQSELFAKNSEIGRLESKVKRLEEAAK